MSPKMIQRFQWASRVLALLGLLGGIVAAAKWLPDSVQQYSALATALTLAAARWCEQQIPARKEIGTAPVVTGLFLAVVGVGLIAGSVSCTGTPWRVTSAVRSAGTMADQAIAYSVRTEATRCIKSGISQSELPACVRKSGAWKAQQDWRAYGVPAVNSAIVATVAALTIADQTREKVDWIATLKPAACALVRIVRQWGAFLGSAKQPVLAAVAAVKGVSCE